MDANVCAQWRTFAPPDLASTQPGVFAKQQWRPKQSPASSPLVPGESPSTSTPGSEDKEPKVTVVPDNIPSPDLRKKKKKKKRKKRGLPVWPYLKQPESVHILDTSSGPVLFKVTIFKVESPLPLFKDENIPKPHYIPMKYWNQRYSIFSRYDEGILLDEESWFSVTHEAISKCIAEQCTWAGRVMDGFAGAGGNVIQFARFSDVLAVELDALKLQYLRNNAKVYGVCDRIKFLCGDFLRIAERNGPVDLLFMSPPWGGPDYVKSLRYDIFSMMNPDIRDIFSVCSRITRNIILYMPRNADPVQMASLFTYLPGFQRKMEMQVYYFGEKIKTVACFYGDLVQIDSQTVASALLAKYPNSPLLGSIAAGCDLGSKLARYMVGSEVELRGADALLAELGKEGSQG